MQLASASARRGLGRNSFVGLGVRHMQEMESSFANARLGGWTDPVMPPFSTPLSPH